MNHVLSGVTVPLITALTPSGDPDPRAARPLLDALARAGVTRVMFFGTNGEGPLLNPHLSGDYLLELAPYWRSVAGPAATVTATAFGAGTRETRNRARIFLEASPDAIVVAPPYYFIHSERELVDYYDALEEVGAPIIAYNAPRYTGNLLTPRVIERLFALPHVVGLKDSSGDDEIVLDAIRAAEGLDGVEVSQGNERRMAWALRKGAVGVTPGLANLAPRECIQLADSVQSGDDDDADQLQEQLIALTAIHAERGGVPAMKAALGLRGLSSLDVASPLAPFTHAEIERIKAVLDAWPGEIVSREERP